MLVFIWMGVIFWFSSQEGSISHQKSLNISVLVEKTIEYVIGKDLINNSNRDTFEFIIRKIAHMTEYFILTLLLYNALKNNKRVFLYSFIIAFLYAVTDETHQIFVQGRGPSPVDVGIDSIGSLIYIGIKKIKKAV